MSVTGGKRPGRLNSTVVPTASPRARPINAPHSVAQRGLSVRVWTNQIPHFADRWRTKWLHVLLLAFGLLHIAVPCSCHVCVLVYPNETHRSCASRYPSSARNHLVKPRFERGIRATTSRHHTLRPGQIFQPAFVRPIRGRAVRHIQDIADLVAEFDEFRTDTCVGDVFNLHQLARFFSERLVVCYFRHECAYLCAKFAFKFVKRGLRILNRVV
jgi:hypothetical protein